MSSFATACVSCVLLMASAATPAPPVSRAFHVIESGTDSWTIIDPQQIEIREGGLIRRAWSVRIVRSIVATPPPQPGYVRTLTDYDCQRHEFRWREFTAFARSGEPLVNRQNPAYGWESANKSPDTEAAFQVVCGEGRGRGVVAAESAAKLVIMLMSSWDPPPAPRSSTPLPEAAGVPAPPGKQPPRPAAAKPKTVSLNDLWR